MAQKTRSWNYIVYKKSEKYYDIGIGGFSRAISDKEYPNIDWSVRVTFVVDKNNRIITNTDPKNLDTSSEVLSFPTNTYCTEGKNFIFACKELSTKNGLSYMTDFDLFPIESLKLMLSHNIELSDIDNDLFNRVFGFEKNEEGKGGRNFQFSKVLNPVYRRSDVREKYLRIPYLIDFSEKICINSLSDIKEMERKKIAKIEATETKKYEEIKKRQETLLAIEKLNIEKDEISNKLSIEKKSYNVLSYRLQDIGDKIRVMIDNVIRESLIGLDEEGERGDRMTEAEIEKEAIYRLSLQDEYRKLNEEKRKILIEISDSNIVRKKYDNSISDINKKINELQSLLKNQ